MPRKDRNRIPPELAAPLCSCCGKPRRRRKTGGWHGAHGWCHTCTERWYAAGKPASGVPPRTPQRERILRIRVTTRTAQRDRLTDYAWLISFGETREQAAARTGVSVRTARRVYEPMLAAAEAAREELVA